MNTIFVLLVLVLFVLCVSIRSLEFYRREQQEEVLPRLVVGIRLERDPEQEHDVRPVRPERIRRTQVIRHEPIEAIEPIEIRRAPVIQHDNDDIPGQNEPVQGVDRQSAHDHGVVSALTQNVKKLEKEFQTNAGALRDRGSVISEALALCTRESRSEKELADMKKVLYTIDSTGGEKFMGWSLSQTNVLDMVLWRMSRIEDSVVRFNVQESFCTQLLSCVERDKVVCGTGRMTRLMSVFEGVPGFESYQKAILIPQVRSEIANMAAQIRTEILDTTDDPSLVKRYEDNNGSCEISSRMRSKLRERVNDIYTNQLGMKSSVIDPILEEYCSAF